MKTTFLTLAAVAILASGGEASAQLRPGLPNAPKLHPERQMNSSPAYTVRPTVTNQPIIIAPLPVVTYPVTPIYTRPIYPIYPQPIDPYRNDRHDLERYVERSIERTFGRYVDDVDVDIDARSGLVMVKADVRNRTVARDLEAYVYSMPELRGLRIGFRLERD